MHEYNAVFRSLFCCNPLNNFSSFSDFEALLPQYPEYKRYNDIIMEHIRKIAVEGRENEQKLPSGWVMKISLALSGGAARGAFHLGVLEALEKNGFSIEAISGTSIGAIIGTSYAAGVAPREQLEIFESKAFKKIFKLKGFRNGFFRIDQQQDILKKLIPISHIEKTRIKLHITAVDLISGEIIRFDKGEAIPLCVASSAVLPLFEPLLYGAYYLADGGVMDNLPVAPLLKYNHPIIGVDLHPLFHGFTPSFIGGIKRTLFLTWHASIQEHLKLCDFYITDPKLSNYALLRFKNFKEMFHLGYETTMELSKQKLKFAADSGKE